MDKALRNTLILGIIVIAFSVSYYLVFLPNNKKATTNEQPIEQMSKSANNFSLGDDFYLTSGRKIKVTEVAVGNYYRDYGGRIDTTLSMKGQVSVRIDSENGPLEEADYSKMYIVKGNQLIKLSNSGGAPWGEYWFEMPKTENFDGMELHFGDEAIIKLSPYIKANNF